MAEITRVVVLGASGYAGGELVRLLAGHRRADVTFLGAKDSTGKTLAEVHPHLAPLPIVGESLQPIEAVAIADAADVVFCALPNGSSSSLIPSLLAAREPLVDWFRFVPPADLDALDAAMTAAGQATA